MRLTPGSFLGPYEILAPLGAGGMGEVYRAKDSRLGRDVAVKTLPASVTHDAERLARFSREAHLLASLNHPHIASIYGLEEAAGQRFLVLELVEGETLASRISRGPLPLDEALAIAGEIADALEAAHEKGIVHRDLKPANVALTQHDRVKVLDFGLAKATDPVAPSDVAPLNSPTITSPAMLTGLGMILGTAAYMSPEQARGRPADKRSDIWGFGCVLFEMLAGRRPFGGEEIGRAAGKKAGEGIGEGIGDEIGEAVSDTLAAVLKSEPAWSALPAGLPVHVRSLLEGCLEKNPRDRIGHISTARFVLRHPPRTAAAAVRRSATPGMWLILLAAGAAAGALGALVMRPGPAIATPAITRFGVTVPDGQFLTLSRRVVAVSPDGTRLAFVADGRIYLRSISDVEARPLAGANPGIQPVFSPDGESLVFWSPPALKRISVNGGVPVTICETTPAPFGIDWSDGGIVFVQPGSGIMRVSPSGGAPEVLVRVTGSGGLVHGPHLLPDGDTLLFTRASAAASSTAAWDKAQIVAYSLRTGQQRTIVEAGSDARYVPTGHLLYMVEGSLMAVPFDLRRLAVTGGAAPVVEGVRRSAPSVGGAAQYGLSSTGVLAYVPGPARTAHESVFLYDRQGRVVPLKLPRGAYAYPRVSPDGERLALETNDGKNAAVAIYELSGATSVRRLTFGGNNRLPSWSRDGKRVIFQSDREGDRALFWQPVGGGTAERLTRPEVGAIHVAESLHRDGDVLLFSVTGESETTLWTLSLRDRTAKPFGEVRSIGVPTNAVFSPDGRWVAYQSGDNGTGEATTYVQPFPPNGTKHEIARGGRPMWSPDGKELFLVPAPSQFVSVALRTQPTFEFSTPANVARRFGLAPPANPRPYDILPDGRFVAVDVLSDSGDQPSAPIHVVVNWFEELRTKVPAAR